MVVFGVALCQHVRPPHIAVDLSQRVSIARGRIRSVRLLLLSSSQLWLVFAVFRLPARAVVSQGAQPAGEIGSFGVRGGRFSLRKDDVVALWLCCQGVLKEFAAGDGVRKIGGFVGDVTLQAAWRACVMVVALSQGWRNAGERPGATACWADPGFIGNGALPAGVLCFQERARHRLWLMAVVHLVAAGKGSKRNSAQQWLAR